MADSQQQSSGKRKEPKRKRKSSTKDGVEGRQLQPSDHIHMLDWLETNRNWEKIEGVEKSTVVGIRPKTKIEGFRELAAYINSKQVRNSNLQPLDGESMKSRWRYFFTKWKKMKVEVESSGWGVTSQDQEEGTHTISQKVSSQCEYFERMNSLFGGHPSVVDDFTYFSAHGIHRGSSKGSTGDSAGGSFATVGPLSTPPSITPTSTPRCTAASTPGQSSPPIAVDVGEWDLGDSPSPHLQNLGRVPEPVNSAADEMQGHPSATDEMQGRPSATDEMQGHPSATDELQGHPSATDEMQGHPSPTQNFHGGDFQDNSDGHCSQPEAMGTPSEASPVADDMRRQQNRVSRVASSVPSPKRSLPPKKTTVANKQSSVTAAFASSLDDMNQARTKANEINERRWIQDEAFKVARFEEDKRIQSWSEIRDLESRNLELCRYEAQEAKKDEERQWMRENLDLERSERQAEREDREKARAHEWELANQKFVVSVLNAGQSRSTEDIMKIMQEMNRSGNV